MENAKAEVSLRNERATLSQIIKALTEMKEQHGDIKFFAQLPPNLYDNDYHIGMRQSVKTGEKEAFIETLPDVTTMLDKMMDDMADMLGHKRKQTSSIPTPSKVTCEFDSNEKKIHTSDGTVYRYRFGGCGEAIYINDTDGNEVTVVPTSVEESYILYDEDKDVICAAINGIKK